MALMMGSASSVPAMPVQKPPSSLLAKIAGTVVQHFFRRGTKCMDSIMTCQAAGCGPGRDGEIGMDCAS